MVATRMKMNDPRPDWDTYYMGIALAVLNRADCTRRKVGAIIVKGDRIVSTGYNGAPSGQPGCLSAGACSRGWHYEREPDLAGVRLCRCGSEWPCPESVKPASSYDTGAGACIALHAEQNAILRAGLECRGATLYVTEEPCDGCSRLIAGSGISRVVTPTKE